MIVVDAISELANEGVSSEMLPTDDLLVKSEEGLRQGSENERKFMRSRV